MATRQPSSLDNIVSLVELFKPRGGGTVTESNNVSPDAVNAVVKNILESNQGLAQVASGQKAAGLYNSSTNQMLVNDLVARTAAEAAKLNSSRTVKTQPQRQLNPAKTSMGLLGVKLLAPTLKAATKKFELDDLGNKIADSLFGSNEALAPAVNTNPFTGAVLDKFDINSTYTGLSEGLASTLFSADSAGTEVVSEAINAFGGSEDLASELASLGTDAGIDATSALFDSYSNVASDAVTNWLFADGGRVPHKKNYANGGKVSIIKRNDQLKKKKDPSGIITEANSTSTAGAVASNPGQALGAFGALALGAMLGGPSVMGIANAISNANTGKSVLGNVIGILGESAGQSEAFGGALGALGGFGGAANFGADALGAFGAALGSNSSSDSGGDGTGTGVGGTGADGAGADAEGNSFANGGDIPGHDTKGKDNIQINVSGGEYVIPTDVVDTVGEEFFDMLLAKFHTPIKKKGA